MGGMKVEAFTTGSSLIFQDGFQVSGKKKKKHTINKEKDTGYHKRVVTRKKQK